MPPVKKGTNNKVEVVLTTLDEKKSAVRYIDPVNSDDDVTNVYLKRRGFERLGRPTKIKVTIEAYTE